jgi:hypothetical protein
MKLTKGYKTGKSQPAWKCCRMIRICPPNQLGEIHDVFNTMTEEYESWMCIKVDKNSMNNILQRIFKIEKV